MWAVILDISPSSGKLGKPFYSIKHKGRVYNAVSFQQKDKARRFLTMVAKDPNIVDSKGKLTALVMDTSSGTVTLFYNSYPRAFKKKLIDNRDPQPVLAAFKKKFPKVFTSKDDDGMSFSPTPVSPPKGRLRPSEEEKDYMEAERQERFSQMSFDPEDISRSVAGEGLVVQRRMLETLGKVAARGTIKPSEKIAYFSEIRVAVKSACDKIVQGANKGIGSKTPIYQGYDNYYERQRRGGYTPEGKYNYIYRAAYTDMREEIGEEIERFLIKSISPYLVKVLDRNKAFKYAVADEETLHGNKSLLLS